MSQLPRMEDPAPNGSASRPATPTLEPTLVDLRAAGEAETPPLVLVLWHDAWSDAEQGGPDDWRIDYPVRTVGFLVRLEPTLVSIAQEILPDDDGYRSITHIPTAMIESVTPLAGPATNVNGSSNGHTKNGSAKNRT